MLGTVGTIIGIICGAIIILGIILGIFRKLNKIDNIEKGMNALLFIHRDQLFAEYKDQIKIIFNPMPSPYSQDEKDGLLQKLQAGYLAPPEAHRLTEILKYEESKAKEKDQQIAVLVIGALLLLVALLSKK